MKIIVSTAVSLDGYIDDATNDRLILSNEDDFKAVHLLRSTVDAIFVGANTIRKDNPSLLIRDEELLKKRVEEGKPKQLVKVTVTHSGNLSFNSRFFTEGSAKKIVYTASNSPLLNYTKSLAIDLNIEVRSLELLTLKNIFDNLKQSGIEKLLIEGGTNILTQIFSENLVDEFRLAIAPVFVGNSLAPRLFGEGNFSEINRNLKLIGIEKINNMAILHYQKK